MTSNLDIDHILVCADASGASRRALRVAQQFAAALSAKVQAKHVFDVARVDPELGHFLNEVEKSNLRAQVEQKELAWADVDDVDIELVEGQSIPTLLEIAEDTDLVVVGHSGHGFVAELILGSVAKALVAHAKVPVLVVQTPAEEDEAAAEPSLDARAIVCAVDGSNASTRAAQFAGGLTRSFGTRLELLTVADVSTVDVYDGFYMNEEQLEKMEARTHRRILDEIRGEVEGIETFDHSERIVRGHAKKVLLEETKRDDVGLFVLGRTGKGAFERMLQGSVSQTLTAHAACPVLIVP